MHEHDGILTLMRSTNPIQKGLALKSHLVEPYHLRLALQDPDLRLAAARHPNLTPEQITELLHGDDAEIKSTLLERHDLTPEHLEQVAFDPQFAATVANHPKCPVHVREQAVLSGPDIAKPIHAQALAKNVGLITFPLLGEGKLYSHPMEQPNPVVNTKTNTARTGETQFNINTKGPLPHERRQMSAWAAPAHGVKGSKQTQQRLDVPDPVQKFKLATKIDQGKSLAANAEHESQHIVFARIAQKHGPQARERVISALYSALDPAERAHIASIFQHVKNDRHYPHATDHAEEALAHTVTYLQDPALREKVYQSLGIAGTAQKRQHFSTSREIFNKIRRVAGTLRPLDVGIDPAKEQNRFKAWVQRLAKRESSVSHQLGFSVSFHELIAIAKFLTSRDISIDNVRNALREVGGDPTEAVLTAFGLNNPAGRKAFANVRKMSLHKSEAKTLSAPKSIVGISPGAMQVAQEIQKAYENGEVQPLRLEGKHSKGAAMARTENGAFLLKPGSGNKSPAAGVSETMGSQSRREVLFGAIAKFLGIHEVKPSYLLSVDGGEVAALEMWPVDYANLHRTSAQEPTLPVHALEPYRRSGRLHKWAVLDFVTGNPDRHGDNLMVGPRDEGNQIALIDHGSAFAGPGFAPATDDKSFVPYYLRVWARLNFHRLSPAEQLAQMPTTGKEVEDELREWLFSIDEAELSALVLKYGMDPAPILARLAKMKAVGGMRTSTHINSVWVNP